MATKRENFLAIREVLTGIEGTEDQVAFIDRQVELLDNRKNGTRKPTKDQVANEALKAEFVDFLAEAEGATATDVATEFGVTVQKVSQLMKQLVDAGKVERIEGKGKTKTLFKATAE